MLDQTTSTSFSLTPRQAEVRKEVLTSGAMHCLIYGGSRSGKTFLLVKSVLDRAIFAPGSRHLIVRRHAVAAHQSIGMDTLKKVLALAFPGLPYRYMKKDGYYEITTPGAPSEIWIGGLDDDERVEKILGKEYATIYVNEASEIGYQSMLVLETRLAQKVKRDNGSPLSLRLYVDLNPTNRNHWTYVRWIQGLDPESRHPVPENDYAWGQMNPSDNIDNLDAAYIEKLAGMPEDQRRRFFDGEFANHDQPNQLIPTAWIEAAMDRWSPSGQKGSQTAVGVDVALGGGDRLVIAPRYSNWFDRLRVVEGASLVDAELGIGSASMAAGIVQAHRKKAALVNIDAIGVGTGVADNLKGSGVRVNAIVGSRATDLMDKHNMYGFVNERAAVHWRMREALDPENAPRDQIALPPDERVKIELAAATFEVASGKIRIIGKDKVKEIIGRSPDMAEAVMLANYAQAKLKDEQPVRRSRRGRRSGALGMV